MMTLFDPLQIGPLKLPNRIIVAPMTRARCGLDGIPGEHMAVYYAMRASAGLIITGSCRVSPMGAGIGHDPGLYNDAQIAGWRRVVDAVHGNGGRIFAQPYFGGAQAHPYFMPNFAQPVAPSAINVGGICRTPYGKQPRVAARALKTAEIQAIVGEFAYAARRAIDVGCDGVEIHSCSGYLLHEFMCSRSNRRSDQYGGNVVNRCRLTLEIVEAVTSAVGAARVGIKLSPGYDVNGTEVVVDDNEPESYSYLVPELSKFELAYLHVADNSSVLDYHALLRPLFKGPYIAGFGFTPERAADFVAAGRADAIAFGQLFITNPDLPERIRTGIPLNKIDRTTTFAFGPRGFAEYKEDELPPPLPAPTLPEYPAAK